MAWRLNAPFGARCFLTADLTGARLVLDEKS